jgi:hypothetical protein
VTINNRSRASKPHEDSYENHEWSEEHQCNHGDRYVEHATWIRYDCSRGRFLWPAVIANNHPVDRLAWVGLKA